MTPNPALVDVGIIVVVIVFLLGGFKQILGIISYFKSDPPNHMQYVSTEHCREYRESCSAAMKERFGKIDGELESIDIGDRAGRSNIHRDVRKLEDRMGKTEGYVETMNQRQISQGGLLDRILSELGEVKGRLKAKAED